jgi:hypothetical protein
MPGSDSVVQGKTHAWLHRSVRMILENVAEGLHVS